jgi:hypothetical protein
VMAGFRLTTVVTLVGVLAALACRWWLVRRTRLVVGG